LSADLASSEPKPRQDALRAIASKADPSDFDLLRSFTPRSDENSLFQTAMEELAPLASVANVSDIQSLLPKQTSTAIQSVLIEALGRLRASDASQAILDVLKKSSDQAIKAKALAALGGLSFVTPPDIVAEIIQKNEETPTVLISAAEAVASLNVKQATAPLTQLVSKTKDETVRLAALKALAVLGVADEGPMIVNAVLRGCSCDLHDRVHDVIIFLNQIGFNKAPSVMTLIKALRDRDSEGRPPLEAFAHVVAQGRNVEETIITWLGIGPKPDVRTKVEAAALLKDMQSAWPTVLSEQSLASEFARKIQDLTLSVCSAPPQPKGAEATDGAGTDFLTQAQRRFQIALFSYHELDSGPCWEGEGAGYVKALADQLSKSGYRTEAATLDGQLSAGWWGKAIKWGLEIGGGWIVLWVILILLYPYLRGVQSQVFWNDRLRKVAGFGIIDFALRGVGILRRRMLRPFRRKLAQAAGLGGPSTAEPLAFFADIHVEDPQGRDVGRIVDRVPKIGGCLMLTGESGLGKTTFLKYLTDLSQREGRVVAFLEARDCNRGVYEALASLVEGPVKEMSYLRTLVHTRDMAVIIDGMNEVSEETRALISEFTKGHIDSDVLIASQPMLWEAARDIPHLTLRPLSKAAIGAFLVSKEKSLPADACVTGMAYQNAAIAFVRDVEALAEDETKHVVNILSNPMDLTLVSELLAAGQKPNPRRLDEQLFQRAKEKFREVNLGIEFPMESFSEYCYEQRSLGSNRVEDEQFKSAAESLAYVRMLLKRVEMKEKVERAYFIFRHDRLADFFIYLYLIVPKHKASRKAKAGDVRFRGVYLMIAERCSLDIAQETHGILHAKAQATKDYSLYDEYYRRYRTRTDVRDVVIPAEAAE
jgi:energy-coupling factor transporter ATP-binding protein EcfA2